MSNFPLEVVTPDRIMFADQASFVVAPGSEGVLGITAGHAPLLTALAPGVIKVDLAGGTQELFATSGGFLQITREKVTILADTAELSGDIDLERARRSLQSAEQQIATTLDSYTIAELKAKALRAQNRIRVAEKRI